MGKYSHGRYFKKHKYLSVICIIFFVDFYTQPIFSAESTPHIMLFTCQYGSGHRMATQGIVESLPDCVIQVVDIYDDPLRFLDPMRDIFPLLSSERIFNEMAKKEQNYLLNLVGKVGPKALLLHRRKIESRLLDYVARENPDMLISCVPLVNSMLLSVSKKLDIPFLVITTDIDISAFCYGFQTQDCMIDRRKFRMTVPYGRTVVTAPQAIQESLQYGFGYPMRRAFFLPVEGMALEQLRAEYGIQDDENVILVMMGSHGTQAAKTYARLLVEMTDEEITQIAGQNNARNKIRLICLCGDATKKSNQLLMRRLNALNSLKQQRHDRVSIYACPGTPRIAELASLPELCAVISKPGGSTVNEMIKKKVPMVYHVSGVPLDWERGNMEYGQSRNLGEPFHVFGRMGPKDCSVFAEILSRTFALHQEMQNGEKFVAEAEIDFSDNLRKTVCEMLGANN